MLILNRRVGEGLIINTVYELEVIEVNNGRVELSLKKNGRLIKESLVAYYKGYTCVKIGNDSLNILIAHTTNTIVRLGLEAPKSVKIARKELVNKTF